MLTEEELKTLDHKVCNDVSLGMDQMMNDIPKDLETSQGHVLRHIIEAMVWYSLRVLGEEKATSLVPRTVEACFSMFSEACPRCEWEEPGCEPEGKSKKKKKPSLES